MQTDVLIVGAGPTGLVLALWLNKLGVRFRIVDRSAAPGETSRALAVHARTLEFHRQIGLADEVVAAGIKIERITVRESGRAVGRLPLGDFGAGLSPFPFVLALPQDVHERILVARLEGEGVRVERGTELTGFTSTAGGVAATLVRGGRTEIVEAAYLCGCDGAHSTVRHALGVGFLRRRLSLDLLCRRRRRRRRSRRRRAQCLHDARRLLPGPAGSPDRLGPPDRHRAQGA